MDVVFAKITWGQKLVLRMVRKWRMSEVGDPDSVMDEMPNDSRGSRAGIACVAPTPQGLVGIPGVLSLGCSGRVCVGGIDGSCVRRGLCFLLIGSIMLTKQPTITRI